MEIMATPLPLDACLPVGRGEGPGGGEQFIFPPYPRPLPAGERRYFLSNFFANTLQRIHLSRQAENHGFGRG